MAENSKIEWCHHTFNPVLGCQKVGAGCDNCYAEGWAKRSGLVKWGAGEARRVTSDAYWRQPLKWDREAAAAGERRRVFPSLCDPFDKDWPAGIRDRLFALTKATPHLDWLLLTKRPGNIAKMLPPDWGHGYPNVWIGCTVVNQAEADRDIPKLLAVPAVVRFLSMEPLLGPVDLAWAFPDLRTACCHKCGFRTNQIGSVCPNDGSIMRGDIGLDWVIVGGESGPGARPMHIDWARSLRDQCVAAGVSLFFKQWGEWELSLDRDRDDPDWRCDYSNDYVNRGKSRWLNLDGGCGFHGDRFCVMRRVGKKAAGRLLDGREWNQMPGVAKIGGGA